MSTAEFDPNLIRLPLDYKGTPALAEIRVTVPSVVPPDVSNGEFTIGLELRDRWGFHLPKQSAHLELSLEGASGEVPAAVPMLPEYDSHHAVRGHVAEKDRVFRVRVRDRETGIEAISNPSWAPAYLYKGDHKLYWGDLHCHRLENPSKKRTDPLLWSYGPATVDEVYRFARDVVHLDFTALTDHDYALSTDEWREIQEGAEFYNQPERFVTLLGYEWSWNRGPDADCGHRNIIFRFGDMPLISSNWKGSNTPQDLFNIFRNISRTGRDILSIPHHPARLGNRIWHNWETMDPDFERLMEVFSHWGSSEHEGEPFALKGRNERTQWDEPQAEYPPYEATGHFLQDGLRQGFRFGFVGGSESHDGRATSSVQIAHLPIKLTTFNHHAGMTGLWSRRRERDAMFSSLWNRRAIGTTGVRILLDFDVDNQPMGETIRVQTPPKRMNVRIHGTAPLAKVVVVKNNHDWHVVENPGWECAFTLDQLDMPQDRADWYYVRVTQEDGEMAWSSPIWIEDARRIF